jgi:hypothetical protein
MGPKALLFAALISTAAAAQAGGPTIAYVNANGSAQQIYLVNPDGSALTRLYTAPRKTGLGLLDLKPGGNEVAFTEQFRIKLQKFFDNGQPDGGATLIAMPCTAATGNSAYSPDYHPSGDGRLVFVTACSGNFGIWQYTPASPTPQLLFSTVSTNRVRWNAAGTHLYYDEEITFNSGNVHLKRRDMTTGSVEDLGDMGCNTGGCVDSFDVTRTGDRVVYGSTSTPKLYDHDTMASTAQSTTLCVVGGGTDFHYSPTDGQFVYRTPHAAKGDYILLRSSSCAGGVTSLTGKGSWGRIDWGY